MGGRVSGPHLLSYTKEGVKADRYSVTLVSVFKGPLMNEIINRTSVSDHLVESMFSLFSSSQIKNREFFISFSERQFTDDILVCKGCYVGECIKP